MLLQLLSQSPLLLLLCCCSSVLADSYGVPKAPAYGAPPPADSYGAPLADTYGAPPSYAAPAASSGLDLAVIIIPIIALVGLFLLFPSFVNITTVRRRRRSEDDDDDDVSSSAGYQLLNRLQHVYNVRLFCGGGRRVFASV